MLCSDQTKAVQTSWLEIWLVICEEKKCGGCWLSFSETPVVKREWTVKDQLA